jgi:hypothetical protein
MKEMWDKKYNVSLFFVYSQNRKHCIITKTKEL